MATPVTLAVLQARVYQRLNMQNQVSFAPNAEIIDAINLGIARWYDEVCQVTFAGQFYRRSATFVTQNAVSLYPYGTTTATFQPGGASGFITDLYRLISVDAYITQQGSNQVIDCRPYQEEQRNRFKFWPMIWIAGAPLYYQEQGQAINFTPAPPVVQVGLNYMPNAPVLVNGGDTLDTWNGWEEYIVLYAATKLALKDRDQVLLALLKADMADELQRIRTAASSRDAGPECVHEVPEADFWGSGDPGF